MIVHRTENLFARRGLAAARVMPGIALVACVALLLLASCSESQRLTVATDGSGSADVEVTLAPMLVSYLHDLMASMGNTGGADAGGTGAASGAPPIFDLGRIRAAFGRLPGVSGVAVESPSEGSLSVRFAFRSLGALLEGPQTADGQNPITLTKAGGATTIRFSLDRENVQALTSLPPVRDDPLFLALLPKGKGRVTEAQELELLDYAFGDYAPEGSTVAAVVRASAIRVTLAVGGQIVSQQGGTVQGNTVLFTLPLLRLLTLEQPIAYEVTYR